MWPVFFIFDLSISELFSGKPLSSLVLRLRYVYTLRRQFGFRGAASPFKVRFMKQQTAEIKRLSDKLDALNRKEKEIINTGIEGDLAAIDAEKLTITTEIERLRKEKSKVLSAQAQKIQKLAFSRPITKAEQADMGALKKTVRGLEVVHPMTALGREMGLKEVTGFARNKF